MAKTATKTQDNIGLSDEDRAFGEQAAAALEEAMAKSVIRQRVPANRQHTSAVVTSRGGGLGKTTLAQILRAVARARDGVDKWKLVRIDSLKNPDDDSNDLRADLEIKAVADVSELRKDGSAALYHYDEVGGMMLEGNVVIDNGSNVEESVAAWIKESPVAEEFEEFGVGVDVLVLADTEPKGLKSAKASLELWHDTLGGLPDRRLFLVLNDKDGRGFPTKAGVKPAYDELIAYSDEVGADIVRIAHGDNALLESGKDKSLSMMESWRAADVLFKEMGWGDPADLKFRIRRSREKKAFHAFLQAVTEAITPVLPRKRG